jgi:DNA phosphorothioation-dependent restriction protein DptG
MSEAKEEHPLVVKMRSIDARYTQDCQQLGHLMTQIKTFKGAIDIVEASIETLKKDKDESMKEYQEVLLQQKETNEKTAGQTTDQAPVT